MPSVAHRVSTYLSDQDLSVIIAKSLLFVIVVISIYFFYTFRGNWYLMSLSAAIAVICIILLMVDPASVRFWLWKMGIEAQDPRQDDDVVGEMQALADDENIRDAAEEVEWDTQGNRRLKFKDP